MENLDECHIVIFIWVASTWSIDREKGNVPIRGGIPGIAARLDSKDLETPDETLGGTRVSAQVETFMTFPFCCTGSEVISRECLRHFSLSWTNPTTRLRGKNPCLMVWPLCSKGYKTFHPRDFGTNEAASPADFSSTPIDTLAFTCNSDWNETNKKQNVKSLWN